jgi:hypothetical protein
MIDIRRDLTLITFGMWSSVLVIWLAMLRYDDQTATRFAIYGTMLYFLLCFVICLVISTVDYFQNHPDIPNTKEVKS